MALRVLFVTRPQMGLNYGGLERKILQLEGALNDLGINIVRWNPWENQIPNADVCHFFSTNPEMRHHFVLAKRSKKPIVFSPVISVFDIPLWLHWLEVKVACSTRGFLSDYRVLAQMVTHSDVVLPLHEQEAQRLRVCFGVSDNQIKILPNGLDQRFGDADPRLFREKVFDGDFVLQAGSVDPNKNQAATIEAVRGKPYKLIVIGGPMTGSKGYLDHCRSIAGENVQFMGNMSYDDPLFHSAFRAAKAFVLPSFTEVMPQTLYQAALAGCSLVVSSTVPVDNQLRPLVRFVNPHRVSSLRQGIEQAMAADRSSNGSAIARTMPTWEDIARRLKQIYCDLLGPKSREQQDRAVVAQ
jgi:glycosyltransferase involved in cell wall biosynthesis